MSTVTKQKTMMPAAEKGRATRTPRQLRKDRIVALVVLIVVVAMMAAMMWLASLSPAPVNTDYWPMMP